MYMYNNFGWLIIKWGFCLSLENHSVYGGRGPTRERKGRDEN